MGSDHETATEADGRTTARDLHLFMRLAREWELRFERLFRAGTIGKWYSAVGHEATTVGAAAALAPGDALLTLHRDSGAILRYYFELADLVAAMVPTRDRGSRAPSRGGEATRGLLYRLACQVLGRADGFTGGRDRSYHYNLLRPEDGVLHVGMISHLGAMVPVAAGVAFALRDDGGDRVALNFIGEGGTSTGDFHEGLNLAAVMRLPLVVVVENNGYAFSTPTEEQYACEHLAARGAAYGIPGVEVDGGDPEGVLTAVRSAVERARGGGGPTLIEAHVPRLRGHSEGDGSGPRETEREAHDPLVEFERRVVERGDATAAELEKIAEQAERLVVATVDRALAAAAPVPGEEEAS